MTDKEKLAAIMSSLPASSGTKPPRVPRPDLPERDELTPAERWQALLWTIETAQSYGDSALRGLAIALSRMIQAEQFEALLMDGRMGRTPDRRASGLLWDEDMPVTKEGRKLHELLVPIGKTEAFDLASTAVVANIYAPEKLVKAMQNIHTRHQPGGWRQDSNHHAVCWHPWPLVWVDGGNHSVTAAILRGGGELKCVASYDASPLLEAVRTDGYLWLSESGESIGSCGSLPFAGIFEVGRRLCGF